MTGCGEGFWGPCILLEGRDFTYKDFNLYGVEPAGVDGECPPSTS